jgi:outer membrane protein assembly factor BamB
MRRLLSVVVALFVGSLVALSADWLTDGGNPQRTAWQKDEKTLSIANVKNMKLLWKVKTDNVPREMHSMLPTLVASRVITSTGPKEIAVVTGVSDNIYAIDVNKGDILWKKHFEYTTGEIPRGAGTLCPGGITATPVIGPTSTPGKYTIYAASWDGMLHQLNVADGTDVAPPSKFMPGNGKPYALNLWDNVIYTHTAQNCGGNPNVIYAYDLASHRVSTYAPAGGGMWGRTGPPIDSTGVVYAGTGDGLYDPDNHIYGQSWIAVKMDPQTKELRLKDHYAPTNAEWLYKRDLDFNVTPAIFTYKGRELWVSSSKECRIWLLDTKYFGGEDHRTPLDRTPLLCNEEVNFTAGVWGSMASWEDGAGTRWVLTPFWGPKHPQYKYPIENGPVTNGAVAAFKVVQTGNKFALRPAWVSRDMKMAEPPVVANGIVFGYGSGENTEQRWVEPPPGVANPTFPNPRNPVDGSELPVSAQSQRRIAASTHAVLYALDGQTGKELWSSGNQITSWNHWSGLSVANGHVYIGTYDGNVYCFGLAR